MNFLSKWETQLAHGSFTDTFDQEELLNEILQSQSIEASKNEILGDRNLFDYEDLYQLKLFRDKVVLPYLNEYATRVWKYPFWQNNKFELKAWLTSAKEGYFQTLHSHKDAHLGACFYLMVSDDLGGEIKFYDPRFNFNRGYGFLGETEAFKPQTFTPKTGDYIIFPSSLFHEVNYFKGALRVALIVDLYITE